MIGQTQFQRKCDSNVGLSSNSLLAEGVVNPGSEPIIEDDVQRVQEELIRGRRVHSFIERESLSVKTSGVSNLGEISETRRDRNSRSVEVSHSEAHHEYTLFAED